jgi:hypothetical protein
VHRYATAGENATFVIQARDQYDNDMITPDGAGFTVQINGPGSVAIHQVYGGAFGRGAYNVSFVATAASVSGPYSLIITLGSQVVKDGLKYVEVFPADVSAQHSTVRIAIAAAEEGGVTATTLCKSAESCGAALPAAKVLFHVKLRDRFGNDVVAAAAAVTCAANVTGPGTRPDGAGNVTVGLCTS